jgi:LAO/AO transport system kinase
LLLLPGAGDELQGIKRGILEWIDLVAVNKADGDNRHAAAKAASQYESALRFVHPVSPSWTPPVLTCSGRDGDGLEALWEHVERHRRNLAESGDLEARRREQHRRWMWSLIGEGLLESFRRDPKVASSLARLEEEVVAGEITPTLAARRLLDRFAGR